MNHSKKILLRADGNNEIGLGHIYRLLAIYEMLKSSFDCIFVTQNNTPNNIFPKNLIIEKIPKSINFNDEPDWLKQRFSINYLIIADGYNFISEYQKQIKELGFKLVYIDDLVSFHQFADLVINHASGINEYDYKKEVYTKLALGNDFAILRPEFLEAAKRERIIKTSDTAFICFGGADYYDLTLNAVLSLVNLNEIKKINVIIGAANQNTKIHDLQKVNKKINILKNLNGKEMLKIMQESNLAIAPASTVVYELCCVKMPIISGFYVDNQKNIYSSLLRKNAIFGIENFNEISNQQLENIIRNKVFKADLYSLTKIQQQIFDGKSNSRIINLIENI